MNKMIKIKRESAPPNKWTFSIPPIKKLIQKYVGGGSMWADPYAGKYSPAQFTNDLNPESPAKYHMDAVDFCRVLKDKRLNGVIIDPPYSYQQVSRSYKNIGKKATSLDTSNNFYNRVMNTICDCIIPTGLAITCGWNSNGFGKARGFEIIEILIVAHGGHHNDTIVTVEQKKNNELSKYLST